MELRILKSNFGIVLLLLVSLFVLKAENNDTKALFKAVKRGDKKAVQEYLNSNIDVNVKDDDGNTLLHIAARENNKKIIELLITKGANPNEYGKDNTRPLHCAVIGGIKDNDMDAIKLLISKGADVDASDNYGTTPLRLAVGCGHKKCVQLFINNKAHVASLLLHAALVHGFSSIARVLIANGVDVNTKDYIGETPLHDVARSWFDNQESMIKLLITNGANINANEGPEKDTPLHHAAHIGHLAKVQELLCGGANKSLKNINGDSPSQIAKINNHNDVVDLIDNSPEKLKLFSLKLTVQRLVDDQKNNIQIPSYYPKLLLQINSESQFNNWNSYQKMLEKSELKKGNEK